MGRNQNIFRLEIGFKSCEEVKMVILSCAIGCPRSKSCKLHLYPSYSSSTESSLTSLVLLIACRISKQMLSISSSLVTIPEPEARLTPRSDKNGAEFPSQIS